MADWGGNELIIRLQAGSIPAGRILGVYFTHLKKLKLRQEQNSELYSRLRLSEVHLMRARLVLRLVVRVAWR